MASKKTTKKVPAGRTASNEAPQRQKPSMASAKTKGARMKAPRGTGTAEPSTQPRSRPPVVRGTWDARGLMQRAIDVMRGSIQEPRSDSKASPFVGAVLCKPDGGIETAYRGELREGDHAEYTLLERKNRSNKLDDCVLVATLEPCAPGSRHPPKLGCAERIVLARIKEVWVGIEDPDPTVDRKGIKYLQDKGVTVHMFDRDLQKIIRHENAEFIKQALRRAAREATKPKTVTLSTLEHALPPAVIEDLSDDALGEFRRLAGIEADIDSEQFRRRLLQQGFFAAVDDHLVPTGFGLLLFGKQPRTIVAQAALLATIHYPDGKEETNNFDGPLVLVPAQVERWLQSKLPNTLDRSQMHRRQVPTLPFELIREAIVNALVHRDYDIEGAKCHLVVTPTTIVVRSPGGPPPPITLEQLQSFNAPALSRNPQLHYVFSQMELMEERGLGMKTLKSVPEKLGLPLPRFSFEEPYLVLTLYRSVEGATAELPPEVMESLNKDEQSGWEFLATKTSTTKREYAAHFDFDDRKAERHLKKFIRLGLLRRVGAGPSTAYEVVR